MATTDVYHEPIVPEASQELMNVTGEFVVDIIRRIDDQPESSGQVWEIRCHRYENPHTGLIQSMTVALEKGNHPSAISFSSQVRDFDPQERVVLLKSTQPVASSTPPDREQQGILIWIDINPPPKGDRPDR